MRWCENRSRGVFVSLQRKTEVKPKMRTMKKIKENFQERFEQVRVAVISFEHNDMTLNFLIDTGSDCSFIRSEIVSKLDVIKRIDSDNVIQTANGEAKGGGKVFIEMRRGRCKVQQLFIIHDGVSIWDNDTLENGEFMLHGILGCNFLRKHNFKINFKTMKMCGA